MVTHYSYGCANTSIESTYQLLAGHYFPCRTHLYLYSLLSQLLLSQSSSLNTITSTANMADPYFNSSDIDISDEGGLEIPPEHLGDRAIASIINSSVADRIASEVVIQNLKDCTEDPST